jgi:tetratricopeptide (TPR) repeat protein
MTMTSSRIPQLAPTLFISALIASGCTPKRIDELPITIMRNGDRVAEPTRAVDAAAASADAAQTAGRAIRDSIAAAAYTGCAPDVCAALGRGEIALGMNEAQVLAATRTTSQAWTVRRSGGVAVLAPRDAETAPRDAVAPVALVQVADGRVASVTYSEPQGLRTVSSATDVSNANRARAEALVKEGDALAAAGDFTGALERYDRASVVDRADPMLEYKMATSLDKLLRPREAELRYTLFLHRLELEKIEAVGNANARLAEAIAQARQRVIVLEKQNR